MAPTSGADGEGSPPAAHGRIRGRAMTRPIPLPSRARSVRAAAALAAAAVMLLLAVLPALAIDELPQLRDRVTDQAGVLESGDTTTIQTALDRLDAEHNIQLFVAFVDTTGVEDVSGFTKSTAEASSLGGNDALLLVATGDRSDALWVGDSLAGVTDAEIDEILSSSVEPRLQDGDFAAAAVAGAQALGDAASGEILPTIPPAGGATSG